MNKTQEDPNIHDNGGSRSGNERRQNLEPFTGEEQRSGSDRRNGLDRRNGRARRKTPDRRNTQHWDGSLVERRDAFRKKQNHSS